MPSDLTNVKSIATNDHAMKCQQDNINNTEICKPLVYQLAELHTVNFNLQIKYQK